MFESLGAARPDAILALMAMFREDPRTDKVDLGVGVYKDASGNTPIIGAIRKAERLLYDSQTTKTYVGPAGDAAFNSAMIRLVFGEDGPTERVRACQAPGGSGALRIIAELMHRARPDTTTWLSDPTWPNHVPLLGAAGLQLKQYPYFDPATGTVRFDDMVAALDAANPGDVLLLHGCCHNPTGANLTAAQWRQVTDLVLEKQLFPFIDLAYQGFGDGLEEDVAGLRHMAGMVPEMAIAASCSKNLSVYRERTGAALLLGRTPDEATTAMGQLLGVARGSYSMPPDHGAAAVKLVLESSELSAEWKAELDGMRTRMLSLREGFAEALRRQSNTDRFDFLKHHRGMFSRLGATPEQVERLREEHGVYMVGDSRINIAGLPEGELDKLAAAIWSVMGNDGA